MDICINHVPGSYSDRWISYCKRKGISFSIVNCRDDDIIDQLEAQGCRGLLWHWQLSDYRTILLARQLTFSLEKKGIKVFPDIKTSWHYDDKLGQKYLLEAIKAPLVRSYAFFTKKDAFRWIEQASFPKVFKLRSGAGSSNVSLVKSKREARSLARKAFGRGFSPVNSYSRLKERIWILKRDRNLPAAKKVAGGLARLLIPTEKEKMANREKGYIYFQDFIPDNNFDTRLSVVGNRCFGAIRYCRPNDFRASGSGLLSFDPELVDLNMVKLSFDLAAKLESQSMNFDFILDRGVPKVIEISYCHPVHGWDDCPGYWDSKLNWHAGFFLPQEFILEDFVQSLKKPPVKKVNPAGIPLSAE